MKADALNARNLFDGNVHYEIPVYQRPYVWDQEKQWEPLWADIVRVSEQVVRAGQDIESLSRVRDHFLGAIVYEPQPPVVGDVTRHRVVDGQQRTTTLQLLIDAVHQVLVERDHEVMAEDLEGLILNKATVFRGKPERFKLWPSKWDRDAFSQAMDPKPDWSGEHRVVAAHRFFREQAEAWLAGEADADGDAPPGDELQRVYALSSTLQHRLRVVAINLAGSDDSQLIFETLNDRGTPLLKADLIKNWIFAEAAKVGADVESWPDTYWGDFDDEWWRKETAQGRHYRSRIDIFLQYWLTMRLRDEVLNDDVFRRFVEYAQVQLTSPEEADGLMGALRRDANTFRKFAELSAETPEGAFYVRVVEAMELAATSPLLLWMLSDNHQVPADQIRLGLSALESWVIRRTLLRYTMKDVNKMMVTILKRLDSVRIEDVGTAVRSFLANQTTPSRVWPSDTEMATAFPSTRVYGNIRQSRVRVILQAVEFQLRTERHEPVPLPEGLEIEHVMPQGWRAHWQPIPLTPEEAARRDHRINCIGNLTLLSKKLNGALSHRPWTDDESGSLHDGGGESGKGKRSLIDQYSLLVLSKELIHDHPQVWTDADIDARSRFLTSKICEVWPRPDVPSS